MSLLQNVRLRLARRNSRLPLQQRLLQQPLPSPRARVTDIETVALDFETTGLDARRDHVIAAGWVRVRGDRIVMASAREVHVRTHDPDGVGQSAVIHGIVDSDLEDAASGETLLEQLLPELAGRAIVAHAVAIERSFPGIAVAPTRRRALAEPVHRHDGARASPRRSRGRPRSGTARRPDA